MSSVLLFAKFSVNTEIRYYADLTRPIIISMDMILLVAIIMRYGQKAIRLVLV